MSFGCTDSLILAGPRPVRASHVAGPWDDAWVAKNMREQVILEEPVLSNGTLLSIYPDRSSLRRTWDRGALGYAVWPKA